MGKYVGSYKFRIRGLLIAIISIIIAVLLCSILFGKKANRIGSQLLSYSMSEYSYIYKLNYPLKIHDEYIYADTNIFLYTDSVETERVSAVVLMQNTDCQYSPDMLGYSEELAENEVVVSRNIADKYSVSTGDVIYVLYTYSITPIESVVVEIGDANYDFENPDIDNDIGIVILGYNEQYDTNTENKYICFSKESLSSEISQHAQMLDIIINKSSNSKEVFDQGLYILIFAAIMIAGALVASELYFYKQSAQILKRHFLKGMPIRLLTVIPLLEHIVFSLCPLILSILVVNLYIPADNRFVGVLYILCIAIAVLFCIFVWFGSMKYRTYRVR